MKGTLLIIQTILGCTTSFSIFSAAGPTLDPCTGTTCGKGAECRLRSTLVVCVCPEGTEGDPFEECKLQRTTTDSNPTSSVDTDFLQNAAATSTQVNDLFKKISPSHLSPTRESSGSNYPPGGHGGEGDDLTAYFPSAPPTLSHYAHTPPFSHPHSNPAAPFPMAPNPEPRPTENQYHFHEQMNRHQDRNRPQNSFQGNINHDFPTSSSSAERMNSNPSQIIPSSTATSASTTKQGNDNPGNIFNILANDRNGVHMDRLSEQSQRHGGQSNNQHFPAHPPGAVPINHVNNPSRISSLLSNSNQFHPHHPPTHFGLMKQETQIQQRQDLKDPLGIYVDCVTIKNRVVCADTSASSRHDLHPPHPAPQLNQWNQGFEHRLIAIGNENMNTFHTPPPPKRVEAFPNPIKIKPSLSHLRPGEDRPHFQNGYHHSGPPGTINLFPVASSTEVQSDVIKSKPDPQQHVPQHAFPETKPYAPQAGSEEAKLCHQMCGEGSVCRVFHSRAICGCPEGHTGDPAKKCFPEMNSKFDPNSCQRHTECPSSKVCLNSQCTDPCLIKNTFDNSNISSFHDSLDAAKNKNENMCGPNSKCSVIEHTQLCSCEQNYYGNPYIGCVP